MSKHYQLWRYHYQLSVISHIVLYLLNVLYSYSFYFVFAKKLKNRFGNNNVNFELKHLSTTLKYRRSQSCVSRVRFNPPNIAS